MLEFGSDEPQVEDVQSRLKHNTEFWKEILHAPSPILYCIEKSHRFPLKFIPSRFLVNHHTAKLHTKFVSDSIDSLLVNDCIIIVHQKLG